jgi:hypothetical protein
MPVAGKLRYLVLLGIVIEQLNDTWHYYVSSPSEFEQFLIPSTGRYRVVSILMLPTVIEAVWLL